MANKKLKILYVAQFLWEETDEEHTATVKDIIRYLEQKGIDAERKTIYSDLELLEVLGMDIVRTRTKTSNVYLGSRNFELPELKMLVDVVQASPFLTKSKSLQLIGKLEKLASRYQAEQLRRRVYVVNRIKTPNEQLYYHVDGINAAIRDGKKVTFRYFDWDIDGRRIYRHGGERYCVNPVELCVEKNYYLIAYEKARGYIHYRVDRMSDLQVSEEPRDELPVNFDLAEYVKGIFDMYVGESAMVLLEFDRKLLNAVIDRFGSDAHIRSGENGRMVVSAQVNISPTFLSWVACFGSKMRILAPASAQHQLIDLCRQTLAQYE